MDFHIRHCALGLLAMSNPAFTSVDIDADFKRDAKQTEHERIMGLMGDLSAMDKVTIDEIRNDLLRELENREPVCAECESSNLFHGGFDQWWWCNECQENVSVVIL